ncbi:MAG: glycosyltransferase family 4 protein [Chloroflexi bacterium]|nr:glycosyltransferase family 4 protein [Chloroflexota bacterium]
MTNKKLKIAVFHCGFVYSGGGERIVLEEVTGLRRRGHQVVCLAPSLDRTLCYPDFVDKVGVQTFLPQLPKEFPLRDALIMVLSSLLAPVLALRFRDIDVFVGANQPGAWIAYCMAKVLGKPYVVYLNQPNRLIYPRRIDRETGWQTKKDYHFLNLLIQRIKPFVAWADHISFTRAHTMLANGAYIAGVIERVYGRNPVLCPAGCHPQPRELLRLNPHTAYQGSFVVKDFTVRKPYVLITNRHDPQKMFEYVIEAMVQVLGAIPEVTLVIPGPFTSHTPRLVALAERVGLKDKVIFLGQIAEEDLQHLYQEAAVYCYPAPEEDFGMGVIESMAWGVPVVAWKHAGPTVTVVHGVTGYLAEPYQVDDYARGIVRLLQDPQKRAEMGKAARDHVEKHFTWEHHTAILEEAIHNALSSPQSVAVAAEMESGSQF